MWLNDITFLLNNQQDALIIQIYSVIKLYMFRASSLPIIRRFHCTFCTGKFHAGFWWPYPSRVRMELSSILTLLGSGHQKPAWNLAVQNVQWKTPDMFRALTCPSSGGKIVFTQHLVSSFSVNGCTVHRLKADCSAVCSQPVYCAAVYRERRYQMLCEYNFSSWRWAC